MARIQRRTEVEQASSGFLGLFPPDCNTTQRIPKIYNGEHTTPKYDVVEGRGSQSGWVICWNCATREQKAAIRRVGGGPA